MMLKSGIKVNQYVTGSLIKEMRIKNGLTQAQLAQWLCVSDKAVSKWETGKGYPVISLLADIASAFNISVAELLAGNTVDNTNISANMLRISFYVCPISSNIFWLVGQGTSICHGITLTPLEAEEEEDLNGHLPSIQTAEDEYYVSVQHEMKKEHYISFIAAVSSDRVQLVKLYPEGDAAARFKKAMLNTFIIIVTEEGFLNLSFNKISAKLKVNFACTVQYFLFCRAISVL